MADKQKSPGTGGKTPQAQANRGPAQSAKERAAPPAGPWPPSVGKGGRARRPRRQAGLGCRRATRVPALYLAWAVVALVIVVIAVLFIVKATSQHDPGHQRYTAGDAGSGPGRERRHQGIPAVDVEQGRREPDHLGGQEADRPDRPAAP